MSWSFLPPNTTSHTQPWDQVIIKTLKVYFRQQVILKQLDCMEQKKAFNITVLDAMLLLKDSWSMVGEKTIANCFRYARFRVSESSNGPDDEDDDGNIPLPGLVQMARANADIERKLTIGK